MISFSEHAERVKGSAIRDLMSVLGDPSIISFAGGNPAPVTFPTKLLAELAQDAIETQGDSLLQYGMTEGQISLRESCDWLNKKRGIRSNVEMILPTSGATQAIDLITKVFINDGDTILCESPTFLGALQTFYFYGANVVGVGMKEGQLDVKELEEKMATLHPKFFYVIPNFQNPSGRTWCLEEREKVLSLANKYDVLILEDDPYGELRYDGESMPSIQSMDDQNRVVHLSSFSKTVCPGLRVGYATAHPTIIRKMAIGKQGSDLMISGLSQKLIDGFLRSEQYDAHVESIRTYYTEKRNAMVQAIDDYFPKEVEIIQPEGGLFLWATLPAQLNAKDLFDKAIEQGVAYVPGEYFYPENGVIPKNEIRLNFSLESVENIQKGIERLGNMLQEARMTV